MSAQINALAAHAEEPGRGQPALRLVAERDPITSLTRREREVLALMAAGQGNSTICAQLFIAPKTLERHVQNIFLKLNLPPDAACHRRVCAVLAWLRSPVSRLRMTQVLPATVADRAGCTPDARPTGEEQRLWMQHA